MISLMESEKEEGKWDIINFRRNCGREVSVKNTNSQIQPVQKSQEENKKIIIKKSQLDISQRNYRKLKSIDFKICQNKEYSLPSRNQQL